MYFKSPWAIVVLFSLAAVTSHGAILAQQDFEGGPGGWGYTTTGGAEFNTGTVTNGTPATATWGVGGGTGLSFTEDVGTITFDPIHTLNLTDVTLTLRLAALSLSTGNGLDVSDNFVVWVSEDGGATFKEQIQINGFSNSHWTYATGTGVAVRAYSTSAVTEFDPQSGIRAQTTKGYSYLSVTGLPSVENLVIRLTATDESVPEKWLVDDVVVQTVPEPAAAALGALGFLMLLMRRR